MHSTHCAHPRMDCFAGISAPLGPTLTTKVHLKPTSTLPLKLRALTAEARRGNNAATTTTLHRSCVSAALDTCPPTTHLMTPPSTLVVQRAHSTTTVHAMQFSASRSSRYSTPHSPLRQGDTVPRSTSLCHMLSGVRLGCEGSGPPEQLSGVRGGWSVSLEYGSSATPMDPPASSSRAALHSLLVGHVVTTRVSGASQRCAGRHLPTTRRPGSVRYNHALTPRPAVRNSGALDGQDTGHRTIRATGCFVFSYRMEGVYPPQARP